MLRIKMPAIICAIPPKKKAHGRIKDVPSVNPNFCDDATSVTIAKPNSPSADGSAVMIFTDV